MGDFIELGFEAADKLVDKHFDKVPDSALHIHTYHPKTLSQKARNHRRGTQDRDRESSSSEEEETVDRRRDSRRDRDDIVQSQARSRYPIDPPSPYPIPPQYSHEPPRLRPQYIPSPPPLGGYPPHGGPPHSAVERKLRRDFDETYYSDSYRKSAPRRPKAVTRRSSSYHGPRNRYSSDEDSESGRGNRGKQIAKRGGSMSNEDKTVGRRNDFKGEIEKNFTKSSAGVTGGVLGALVGGWAARKVQESQGRNSDEHKASTAVVTALGAAVGGLAVNAAIDKWQDRREVADQKEAKWEEKWGTDGERDGGRGKGNGSRNSRDRGRRERDGSGYSPSNS